MGQLKNKASRNYRNVKDSTTNGQVSNLNFLSDFSKSCTVCMAPSPYQGIYCLIYICWGVAGWHHRLSLGVNCGSRGPARTAPVWSLSLYVFSFSSSDEPSIGAIHKRRDQFWDHPQTTSSLFFHFYPSFPHIITFKTSELSNVPRFYTPDSLKYGNVIYGWPLIIKNHSQNCWRVTRRRRAWRKMLPWRCATSSHLHVIWMDENSRGSLTTVNTNASPRRLRHEYLEQLANAAVWRHRRLAVDLYRLFEPYLHIQGRPDSLLKVQKSKDCILRASISSVFAENNLIILFHFQVTLRAVASGRAGGPKPPQFLSEQLTLSQPGGQNMSTIVLQAPPDFQTLRRPWLLSLGDKVL